jgi:hypothetical protein
MTALGVEFDWEANSEVFPFPLIRDPERDGYIPEEKNILIIGRRDADWHSPRLGGSGLCSNPWL